MQTDEVDMGMSYEELGVYGRLRKMARCGPVSMLRKLLVTWQDRFTPTEISAKVQAFFRYARCCSSRVYALQTVREVLYRRVT